MSFYTQIYCAGCGYLMGWCRCVRCAETGFREVEQDGFITLYVTPQRMKTDG